MIDELMKHLEKDNFKTLFEGSHQCVDGEITNKILEYLNGKPNVVNTQFDKNERGSETDIVLIYMILLLTKRIEKLEGK